MPTTDSDRWGAIRGVTLKIDVRRHWLLVLRCGMLTALTVLLVARGTWLPLGRWSRLWLSVVCGLFLLVCGMR